jgi:hypothetical protein
MRNSHHIRVAQLAAGVFLSFFCGCVPLKNLDRAVGGRSGTSTQASSRSWTTEGRTTTSSGGTGGLSAASAVNGGTTADAAEPADAIAGHGGHTATSGGATAGGASAGSASGGIVSTTVGGSGGNSISAGSAVGGTGGRSASGGVAGTAVAGGTGGTSGATGSSCSAAPDLPDIVTSPTQGQIIYSAGASWDIDGKQWPAFEIHTPTASYWLVKSAAALVSITDTTGVQWINFSSGFRPNRGVPNLGGCCQPGDPKKLGLPMMTTAVDPSFTVTSTHLRLISKSDNGGYWLVWDFFLTHFTLTVNCAEKPFGFTYRGVPAGAISDGDLLVSSSGASLSPKSPYSGDLPGGAEWVYYNHTAGKHSLFLIQHTGDAITDSYQVADGDTAMWTFGGDQSKRYLTKTPMRFSLGLVDSADDAAVTERIRFVISAIR